MYQTIGLVILVILFIFIIVIFNSRHSEKSLIKGFWSGSTEFCNTSNLELFLIYIGEGSSERPSYILMKNSDGFIINNPVRLQINGGKSFSPLICECIEYNVTIDWLDNTAPDFFPSEQTIHYYPTIGKMVWSNNDVIYAIIYKNNQISDIGSIMPNIKELNDHDNYIDGEAI